MFMGFSRVFAVVSIRQARSTSGHEAAVEPGAWHEIGKILKGAGSIKWGQKGRDGES